LFVAPELLALKFYFTPTEKNESLMKNSIQMFFRLRHREQDLFTKNYTQTLALQVFFSSIDIFEASFELFGRNFSHLATVSMLTVKKANCKFTIVHTEHLSVLQTGPIMSFYLCYLRKYWFSNSWFLTV
jgi:hypothetical protein